MNKKLLVGGVAAAVLVSLGLLVILSEKSHAPTLDKVMVKDTYTLEDLRVTYMVSNNDKTMYNIQVQSQTKAAGADTNAVNVAGRACNTMRGSFVILDASETTDKPIVKTLKDGRKVLDAPIASTMMACMDTTDPKFDDGALSNIISAIGMSIESY